MEASGVPAEYSHFFKIGVLRNPIERLFSLYKYSSQISLSNIDENFKNNNINEILYYKNYIKCTCESIKNKSFNEWVVSNDFSFNNPYDCDGNYVEFYSVKNIIPETKKVKF